MFIDTHLHINDIKITDSDLYVNNAYNKNVKVLITSFCDRNDIILSTEFTNKYKNMYAAIGFHPEYSNSISDSDFGLLEKLIKNNSKIVAIGEIGLDYYWNKDNKDKQREIFKKQLDIASKYNLPVVIHSRDSIGEVYNILKEYNVRGVIHCFSGSLEMAKNFINLGFLLGIGGVVTFKNSKLPEVVKEIDLSNIVLETDSPYLAPTPVRGTVNESSNILYIAEKIAEIKNISIEEVGLITTKNAIKLFDLDIEL